MPSQDDYTAIAIALGAVVLLGKWSLPQVPLDKLNILPESKEFTEGLFNIDPGEYASDQSGSPNPPPQEWWGKITEEDDPLPIPTTIVPRPGIGGSWAVPTPPIISTPDPRSPARVAGQATNNWFTNPRLYPWFAGFEKILENAADTTNADRFN
tara:strand:- start:878 stop:1339 length:462 start_codon:yes stop_codon:yes gene_type:complete